MKRSTVLFGNDHLAPGRTNSCHRHQRQGTNRKENMDFKEKIKAQFILVVTELAPSLWLGNCSLMTEFSYSVFYSSQVESHFLYKCYICSADSVNLLKL